MTKPTLRSAFARSALLLGAALPAFAQPAYAQEQAEPAAADPGSEIVVTAQRRTEFLKDVPIAITALSGDALENNGITSATGLGQLTPGLNYVAGGAFAQPVIRGIGTISPGTSTDANVALYIDGVYHPNQSANLIELNNIERIEVLKGPQGTLFGRNATGGAIRVITRDPDQEARGQAGVSFGRFDEVRTNLSFNLPLGEKVAMNVAGLYKRADGYIRNVNSGGDLGKNRVAAVRGKIALEASETLRFMLSGWFSDTRDNSVYAIHPIDGNNVYRRQGVVFPDGFWQVNLGPNDPVAHIKNYGGSLTGTLDVGVGTITSISAYQRAKSFLRTDSDYSPLFVTQADIPIDEKSFTQEVNFVSAFDGPFNFTAGVFYFDDKIDSGLVSRNATGVAASIGTHQTTKALSGYVEGNYDVTDRLTFILGGRYSTERKNAQGTSFGAIRVDESKRWNSFDPRAVIRYELSDSTNVYASWSRGFKSGSYNLTSLQSDPVDPEKIDAFEVGLKYGSRGILFNASAFYYDYRNIQVNIQTNQGGVLRTILQNAANAESYGFDAEARIPLSPAFELRGGFAWTHATYSSFSDALLTFPVTDPAGVPIGGNTQGPGDASGNDMIRSPDITANLAGTFTTALMGGELQLTATGSYNDGWYWDPGNTVKGDAFFLLNSRASWKDASRRFELFAYGENLTSAKFCLYANNTTTGNGCAPARPWRAGVGFNVFF